MATPSKRWPNNAEWAREDCLTMARKGRKALVDVVDLVDNPVTLREMTKAIEAFREIEARLLAVGPKQN